MYPIDPMEKPTGAYDRAAPEKLAFLQKEAAYLVPEGITPLVGEVTPVIGAHIGPGVVGFSVIKAS